jgi:hypothetical protein
MLHLLEESVEFILELTLMDTCQLKVSLPYAASQCIMYNVIH